VSEQPTWILNKLVFESGIELATGAGLTRHSMAWMELRTLIAKMVFLFDYELVDDKLDWELDSPAYILRLKPELWVRGIPRDIY
jgi:hypothetical protein